MRRTRVALVVVAALVTAVPRSVAALDPTDFPPPSVRLTGDAASSARPRVALDSQGQAVVVWEDGRYGTTEILWQRFTLLGTALTGVQRISDSAAVSLNADVSTDAAGRSHLVWQEGSSAGVGSVYLGRRDMNGQRAKWDLSAGPSFAGHPSVAALADGQADVVSYRWTAGDQDVYYRRYVAPGVGYPPPPSDYACERRFNAGSIPAIQKDPVVAVGGDAAARLLWADMNMWWQDQLREGTVDFVCGSSGGSLFDGTITNAAIDMAGNRIVMAFQYGGEIRQSTASGVCRIPIAATGTSFPSVGTTADTSYAVWQDARAGNPDIYFAQFVDCTNVSGDLPLIQSAGSSQYPDIAVSHSGSGDWVAVWQEDVSGNTEIFMTSSWLLSPSQTFLISGATFDKQLYLNGTDTAQISVVSQSVSGSSGALTLVATLTTNPGQAYPLGQDAFALAPGESHASSFWWPVPASGVGQDFSLHLELLDGGAPVVTVDVPKAAAGTWMTQAEIDAEIAEVMDDACAPPLTDCSMYVIDLLPVVGGITDLVEFKSAVCEMGQAWDKGDLWGASVGALGVVLVPIDVLLPQILEPYPAVEALIKGGQGVMACGDELLDLVTGPAPLAGQAAAIDSLSAHVGSLFAVTGRIYSSEIFAQGGVELRVGVDGSWASADTVSLTEVFVFPELGPGCRWAHVGMGPVPVGSGQQNPLSEVDVEVRSTQAGTLEFGILRSAAPDSSEWKRYPSIALNPQSVARITLSDTTTAFGLHVDLDGDGNTDQTWYPSGAVVAAPAAAGSSPAVPALETWPNPTRGEASLRFDLPSAGPVDLTIYDATGRRVAVLVRGVSPAGSHVATWRGMNDRARLAAPGIYFARLSTSQGLRTKRIVLVR